MSRLLRWAFCGAIPLIAWLFISCDTVDENSGECPERALSTSLKPIFYWGQTSNPATWELNRGTPVGSGRFAQWLDDSHLVASSGALLGGDVVNGLLVLSLASNGVTVDDWELYPFERDIWYMRVLRSTGDIWLLYFENDTAMYPRLSRVTLGAGIVQVRETPLDESWMVSGVNDWPGGEGVLVYATRPSDLARGFFSIKTVSAADSLVIAIGMNAWSGRGSDLSTDGRRLYWGDVVGDWGQARTLVHCLDLTTNPLEPLVVADRAGAIVSIAVDPTNPRRLVINRRVFESIGIVKEDIAELLDLSNGSIRGLDVRTNTGLCYAVRNEFPSWRVDGRALVFRSWGSVSSTDLPSRVWLKEVGP